MLNFEEVPTNTLSDGFETRHFGRVFRAPAPGGWIVLRNESMVFVPDPDHEWTLPAR